MPRVLSLLALACLATGCTTLNLGVSPGEEPLPVFAEADAAAENPGAAAAPDDGDDEPTRSLTKGHDRLDWPVHTVNVPVYRVETNPAPDYRWLVLVNETSRQQGVYPGEDTALDITPNSALNYGEGFTDYLAAAGAIALSPFLMIGRDWDPPQRSPQHRFEMVPEQRTEPPLERWFSAETLDTEGIGETPEPPDADGTP